MQMMGIQANQSAGSVNSGFSVSAAPGRALPAGTMTASGANLAQFSTGQNLFGQVAGRGQDGSYMLRLGSTMLRAQSGTPLTVGQQVNVTVTGQQNGQLLLNMSSNPFSSMDSQVVGQTLVKLNIPLTESNISLANSMLENKMPLDKQSFQNIQKALNQMPAAPNSTVANARVSAACFLQSNGIALTSQNITSLGNFIASNPQIGQQLYNLQGELKKLSTEPGKLSERSLDILGKAPGLLEGMALMPNSGKDTGKAKGRSKALFSSAKQAGIETALTWVGDDEDKWELAALLRQLREMAEENPSALGSLPQALQSAEENLQALRLLNQGKPDPSLSYYYMQIPMRTEYGESAEVWIRYKWREDDTRFIDAEDTCIELLVKTYYLGDLFFTADICRGTVRLKVKAESEEAADFVQAYLPVLEDRIIEAGWQTEAFEAEVGSAQRSAPDAFETDDISSMECCDVQV